MGPLGLIGFGGLPLVAHLFFLMPSGLPLGVPALVEVQEDSGGWRSLGGLQARLGWYLEGVSRCLSCFGLGVSVCDLVLSF